MGPTNSRKVVFFLRVDLGEGGTQTEKYGEFFGGTGRRKSEKTIPSD